LEDVVDRDGLIAVFVGLVFWDGLVAVGVADGASEGKAFRRILLI